MLRDRVLRIGVRGGERNLLRRRGRIPSAKPGARVPVPRKKFRGMTEEVGDIAIEGNLPLELRAIEARAAQPRPENLLRARHMLSEAAGELAALC